MSRLNPVLHLDRATTPPPPAVLCSYWDDDPERSRIPVAGLRGGTRVGF